MKVPISWLKQYVEILIPLEELAERLTLAGLEVNSIRYIGIPQGAPPPGMVLPPSDHLVWDRAKIVLGAIREVRPHPDADRLVLALVDYGGRELEQCVTGAPNLFGYKGQGPLDPPLLAPFAHEGAEVYDGHAADGSRMILKERKLRGIPNRSMVCSEKELGISDDHEAILLLDWTEFGHVPPGTPFQEVLGDAVLDIDVLPNLARCNSIVGVAREVAALTGAALRLPPLDVAAGGPPIEDQAALDIREPELNPRFCLALIRGVELGPSPRWMQRRLALAGMRPINNIVDATNYVMLELGQPLHAFDYDILWERAEGQPPTIITRLPASDERLVTLDGEDHALDDFNMLVADTAGALSIAGIMGGLESEVQDPADDVLDATGIELAEGEGEGLVHGKVTTRRPPTHNVLLEGAHWNYINVRRTMQSQKMSSEAGVRFSRGVHPSLAMAGVRRCIELMRQICGGVIAQGVLDAYPLPAPTVRVDLPLREVERLLGFSLPQAEVVRILRALEFEIVVGKDALSVTVPDHRLDIGSGIIGQADLVEEIARIYGYDRIPNTVIADALPPQRSNVALEREEMVRDALARAGLREIVTYRLTTPQREALLVPPGLPREDPEYVTLANPISADKVVMRRTLLSGMLNTAAANTRHTERIRLFEIGSAYLPVEGNPSPDEPGRLGILLMGPRDVADWQGDHRATMADFFDLKGVIEALLSNLRIKGRAAFKPVDQATFHPGRAALLRLNGRAIGVLGEVHPLVREAFGFGLDLQRPIVAAELDLAALLAEVTALREIKPVPTQPAIYQDIALIVDENVPAAEVHAAIIEAGGELLEAATLFDVYRGDPIPAGKKSLAYSLTYRAPDRTLKDEEVAKVHEKIAKAAQRRLGAALRA